MDDVQYVLNSTLPDDPRLLLSEPFRAVHFVYGLFHPGIPPLSGRALIGSLSAIGYSREAGRGIVLRLRRGGFLVSRRVGREATYTLSDRSRSLIDEIARRSSEGPPPWDGSFQTLVIQVPAAERAFREQLRRHASYAGFGSPLPGLLIAPYPISARRLEPLLALRPPGVAILRGRLNVAASDAGGLAAAAWNLGRVAAAMRREARRMRVAAVAAAAGSPRGPDALAQLWRAIGPFFALLSEAPPLPSSLQPADWPLEEARQAFFQLAQVLAAPARGYVEALDASSVTERRIVGP